MRILILSLLLLLYGCHNKNDLNISIRPLKEYSINFKACDREDCVPFGLPSVPEEVAQVLENRVIDNEFIIYNSLIAAKLYRQQLERAHQSYGIDRKHPVWLAFKKYSREPLRGDFVSSSVIYEWLKRSDYRKNKLLKSELEAIDLELKNIENRIYWK